MKQFIVLIAILPVMLVFLLQFTADQQTEMKITAINSMIYTEKERAKQTGCFTEEQCGRIKNSIAEICGVDAENVFFDGTREKITRLSITDAENPDKMIHYELRVTLPGIMAGGSFMGIKKEDNNYCYRIDAYTASEYIGE